MKKRTKLLWRNIILILLVILFAFGGLGTALLTFMR